MNIMITGGTGLVGRHLTEALTAQNHHIYIMTRAPEDNTNTAAVTYIGYDHSVRQLPVIEAVVNLAGDSLFGYWTDRKKRGIRHSRIDVTQQVIRMMEQMDPKPNVFISGSAVGFYGTSEDFIFTEKTTESGADFLANVTAAWEQTAKQAEALGIRTVYARFGVILAESGALPLMKLPMKLFAGGRIGSGEQWLSWVHIDDVIGLLAFCLFHEEMSGPVNITAPHPKRNKDFTKVLAKVLHRPQWLPVPAPIVRFVIGEMSLLVAKGQYVLPHKARAAQYTFIYPYLQEALQATEGS
ncbi:TIGR01777 family oxidoreductase [Barrientosiimonas marina]|uniref:TIGR01777 family oxidoreductase n=1 Tax=Lentibacillus kimchii TaxID=1542911 RepID=A0ABW2UTX0_9BACI